MGVKTGWKESSRPAPPPAPPPPAPQGGASALSGVEVAFCGSLFRLGVDVASSFSWAPVSVSVVR